MYETRLHQIIEDSVSQIEEATKNASYLSHQTSSWMVGLSSTRNPADYFLHPLAFPMFLLPWWVSESVENEPNLAVHADLAYSTTNGYYYTRLIDDLMDGDAGTDPKLLPALNLFHLGFQMPYQDYFGAAHPFWILFRESWLNAAECALHDAHLTSLTFAQFRQTAGQKCCAANIPVAAVCYLADRPEMLDTWASLISNLSCWHQMMNDLLGWQKDEIHNNATYFLSEGKRRKQPDEPIAIWVMREGFSWGSQLIHQWMVDLQTQAEQLDSPGLSTYLVQRDQLFKERGAALQASFQQLNQLLTLI